MRKINYDGFCGCEAFQTIFQKKDNPDNGPCQRRQREIGDILEYGVPDRKTVFKAGLYA